MTSPHARRKVTGDSREAELLAKVDQIQARIHGSLGKTDDEYRVTFPDDFLGLDILREVIRLVIPFDPQASRPLLARIEQLLDAALAAETPAS